MAATALPGGKAHRWLRAKQARGAPNQQARPFRPAPLLCRGATSPPRQAALSGFYSGDKVSYPRRLKRLWSSSWTDTRKPLKRERDVGDTEVWKRG